MSKQKKQPQAIEADNTIARIQNELIKWRV